MKLALQIFTSTYLLRSKPSSEVLRQRKSDKKRYRGACSIQSFMEVQDEEDLDWPRSNRYKTSLFLLAFFVVVFVSFLFQCVFFFFFFCVLFVIVV